MYKRLDLTQTATHYYWMCNRWLLLRFDFLGAFSILIATIGAIKGGATAGLTGIIFTQAQQYVRSSSQVSAWKIRSRIIWSCRLSHLGSFRVTAHPRIGPRLRLDP
ncbi:hypothetical protein AG1IA_09548 [Rhizoctonia solani AG-1 IA]|uniref:Uncharacterized protein n=1 Tax=Thanatephorus cucumeris (strain AG1-IA) TaxID=983506 RepID=L8WE18_THACA|nr:hypothetical protein AG1IA_09548 [Rhizoctonia solani AG-1 IA]